MIELIKLKNNYYLKDQIYYYQINNLNFSLQSKVEIKLINLICLILLDNLYLLLNLKISDCRDYKIYINK
jgi:hypothetical protein